MRPRIAWELLLACLVSSVCVGMEVGCVHHLVQRDIAPPLPKSQRNRGMHLLATNMRISLITTLLDNPQQDVYPNGVSHACTSSTDVLNIGGATSLSYYCMENGKVKFINNCKYNCTQADVVTPEWKQEIVAALRNVTATVSNFLQVDVVHDTINLVRSSFKCADVELPDQTLGATDFVLFVTVRPTAYLGESIVAFAQACVLEETGRPILGHINVGPRTLSGSVDLAAVILHELIHALGFSPRLFPYWRVPHTATTYYQRDSALYPTGPVKGDGIVNGGNGNFSIDYTALGPGKKIKLITPGVIDAAKNYFGCNNVDGVELENGGDSEASTGSHWEKRLLYFELMTARGSGSPVLSLFTLRALADSGFYTVVEGAAGSMTWGKGLGCSWMNGCNSWPDNYFCSNATTYDCLYDRSALGMCNAAFFDQALPVAYQHFAGEPKKGGTDELADQCPFVEAYAGGSCMTSFTTPNDNVYGNLTGPSSRCFASEVHNSTLILIGASRIGVCLQMVCYGSTAYVRVGRSFYPCSTASSNQVIEIVRPPQYCTRNTNLCPDPTTKDYYASFDYYGILRCGANLSDICGRAPYNGVYSPNLWSWATVQSISPVTGPTNGGTLVTIRGTGLTKCRNVTIGGVAAKNISAPSDTELVFTTDEVKLSALQGGKGEEGDGTVDVDVWCNIPNICPEGCAVAHLAGGFNLTLPEQVPDTAVAAFNDFIQSPLGKAVSGIVGLFVVIIILLVVRSCLFGGPNSETDDPAKAKKKKRKLASTEAVSESRHINPEPTSLDDFAEELL